MPEKKEKNTAVAREKPVPASKKGGPWSMAVPLYMAVLLIVVGLVAGFGFHAVFFPPKVIVQKEPSPSASVNFSFIIHPDCTICATQSSFELLLAQRQIVANPERIDATSTQGKELVQKFGILSFPTVVVNADDLQQVDPGLVTILKAKLPSAFIRGFVVLPEKDLVPETKIYSPILFAAVPSGAACTLPSGKPLLWEFGDNLDSATFDALPAVSGLLNDFNQELEYDFKHMILHANSEDTAIVDECAKKAGLFPAFHQQIIQLAQKQGVLVWNRMQAMNIAKEVGLKSADENAFMLCIQSKAPWLDVKAKDGTETLLAQSYGIKQVPTFVLDCRFLMLGTQNLKQNICLQHPDLKACEAK